LQNALFLLPGAVSVIPNPNITRKIYQSSASINMLGCPPGL